MALLSERHWAHKKMFVFEADVAEAGEIVPGLRGFVLLS